MRCACIDIGSNTTRVLVADVEDGRLTEVLSLRAFTGIGRDLRATGCLPADKVREVAATAAEQRDAAESLGAVRLRAVATAAIRAAANPQDLCREVKRRSGVEIEVLEGEEEARLAFVGATRTLRRPPAGRVAVVDVGGGSSEIAVGTVAEGVSWSASLRIGSGALTDAYVHSDPPSAAELAAVREHAAGILEPLSPPRVDASVAVGGSATSLRRLVGPAIEPEAVDRALRILSLAPAVEVARGFDLEPERVRLLPAGLLILAEAAALLGRPLRIARGGLREGVCLELAVQGGDRHDDPRPGRG